MKVNTDGVLLGAWADVSEAKTVLDIGTGTGVIALMLAQQNTKALIDAIDIDEYACTQAQKNFAESKWNARLTAIHSSLQNFTTDKTYDIVISNPPYFVNDFKTDNEQKNIAKHSTQITFSELLNGIHGLLTQSGKAFLVIPAFSFYSVQTEAQKLKLFVTRHTEVIAVKGKPAYLSLLQFERVKKDCTKTTLTIQTAQGLFTEEYKQLTKEFYLKF